jgi:hypothetical protein
MAPVLSAEGEKINWTNYKTGEKNIYFRLHADNKTASVAIEIAHKDEALQALYFEQFMELKTLLQNTLQEEWIWLLHTTSDSGSLISRIYKDINPLSVFNKSDWPQLISFFKQRIIALDEFWSTAKHIFEAMR